MKDSVLMTVYNRPHLALLNTLTALGKNDLTETEIVIVDDGSSVDYSAIQEAYAALPIKWVRVDTAVDRPGSYSIDGYNNPSYAWNCALAAASGETVHIISSDTLLPPHSLASARKRMLNKVVYCGMVVDMDTAAEYLGSQRVAPLGWFLSTTKTQLTKIADANGHVWDEGYLQGIAFEDNDFTARLALSVGRVVVDLSVCCWHQSHPQLAYSDDMKGWKANEAYTLKKWGGIPWSNKKWHTGHADPLAAMSVTTVGHLLHVDLAEVLVKA